MQIYEHEIPVGSKLYFGKSANIKRRVESLASLALKNAGFREIITPYFSYHQRFSTKENRLIRFNDAYNNELCLRSDSTVDTVRIVTRRIKDGKKWFYIQPVFCYPCCEIYQIGAEIIDSTDLVICANIASSLLKKLCIQATLQISNIQIPHLVCRLLDIDMKIFEQGRIESLLSLNLPWLNSLVTLSNQHDIDAILSIVPAELIEPLSSMSNLGRSINWSNISYAPLYYSKMRYYDKLFFRFLCDNYILSNGGNYEIDAFNCVGFAIQTDNLIEILS